MPRHFSRRSSWGTGPSAVPVRDNGPFRVARGNAPSRSAVPNLRHCETDVVPAPPPTNAGETDARAPTSRHAMFSGPLPGLCSPQNPGHGSGQIVQGVESGRVAGIALRVGEPRQDRFLSVLSHPNVPFPGLARDYPR